MQGLREMGWYRSTCLCLLLSRLFPLPQQQPLRAFLPPERNRSELGFGALPVKAVLSHHDGYVLWASLLLLLLLHFSTSCRVFVFVSLYNFCLN